MIVSQNDKIGQNWKSNKIAKVGQNWKIGKNWKVEILIRLQDLTEMTEKTLITSLQNHYHKRWIQKMSTAAFFCWACKNRLFSRQNRRLLQSLEKWAAVDDKIIFCEVSRDLIKFSVSSVISVNSCVVVWRFLIKLLINQCFSNKLKIGQNSND